MKITALYPGMKYYYKPYSKGVSGQWLPCTDGQLITQNEEYFAFLASDGQRQSRIIYAKKKISRFYEADYEARNSEAIPEAAENEAEERGEMNEEETDEEEREEEEKEEHLPQTRIRKEPQKARTNNIQSNKASKLRRKFLHKKAILPEEKTIA